MKKGFRVKHAKAFSLFFEGGKGSTLAKQYFCTEQFCVMGIVGDENGQLVFARTFDGGRDTHFEIAVKGGERLV